MAETESQPMKHNTALYVGDLHPNVSDSVLFGKFSEVGAVLFARVCRDLVSRESLGYGYVNFRDAKDAEYALENLNYAVLHGRPFRLMWSQRDPSLRKSGKGNVFIKNLDKSILPVELYDTFEQFGKILSCKIAMDEKGQSKGYAFVHFAEENAAEAAISFINGKKLKDRTVFVGPFIPRLERKSGDGAAKFNNCYVKNFGEDMDDERLRAMFSKFGEIKSACVMKDDKGVSKGFGFVCFPDPACAESAVKEMNGSEFKDKILFVGRAQRKEERKEELKQKYEKQRSQRQQRHSQGVNLYVKNLDDSVDDEKLTNAFKQFGEITSAKIMRDTNGQSRGFGFVCFRHPDSAAVAVTNMNNVMLGNKPLYVAIAQRKEDRRAQLTAEYQSRLESMKANSMYPMHAGPIPYMTAPGQLAQNQRFYPTAMMNSRPRWNTQMIPGAMGSAPTAASQMGYIGLTSGGQAGPAQQVANSYATMQMRAQGAQAMGRSAAPSLMQTNMRHMPHQQGMKPMGGVVSATSGMPTRPNMASVAAGGMTRGGPMSGVGGQGQAGVRYNQNARNVQNPAAMAAVQQQSESDLRSEYGNKIYQFILRRLPEKSNPGKITGVLLSMPQKELMELLENEEVLKAKIEEADSLLEKRRVEGGADAGDKDAAKAK